MPKHYRSRKPRRVAKRRNYKKGMSSQKMVVNRALQPFPQRYICKMKYAADVITSPAGLYTFNLNSIYDPDQSGGGHQPYGFDQLTPIYNRYRVISCGWRVTTTTTGSTVQLGTLPLNENTGAWVPTNFSEIKEHPRAKYTIQRDGANQTIISGKAYLPSLIGRTKAQYMADDRYQALVTTNPQEACWLNIFTGNNVGVFVGAIVNVQLEYTVEFFDANQLNQS